MQNEKTKLLVEGAAMVALATVLSLIKMFKLPWGGSVTVLSMLPIFIYSIRWGVKKGMFVSFVYSLAQLLLGIFADGLLGWGLTPVMLVACILIDYIIAFSVLGVAGMFRTKKTAGCIAGIAIACALRFLSHFASGVVIWHSVGKVWHFSTENQFIYSALYNGAYMVPELIITIIGAVVLLSVPQTKKLLLNVKAQF